MTAVAHVDGGHSHPPSTYTLATSLHVTIHVAGGVIRSLDPVVSRRRGRHEFFNLHTGGGRVAGGFAREE